MFNLIDVGINLTNETFDEDREQVIAAAEAAGITRFIVTGTSVIDSSRAVEFTHTYPGKVFCTVGVHPHHATEFDQYSVGALRNLLANPTVVAIGECGLDFFRNLSSPEKQKSAFNSQLRLAQETGKPVFLHQRNAFDTFLPMVEKMRSELSGGVAHCFTGDVQELKQLLALDLYIGITGWLCDERRGENLRQAVRKLPLDRVLIETDAPYLIPRDLQQKPSSHRNEPRFLLHILKRLAKETGHPIEVLAHSTTHNAELLFGLTPTKRDGTGVNS
jgi:TatD DNase family protein